MNVTITTTRNLNVNCASTDDDKVRVIEYLIDRMLDKCKSYVDKLKTLSERSIQDENIYYSLKSDLNSLQSEFDETMKIANLINFGGCRTLSRIKDLLSKFHEDMIEKNRALMRNMIENSRRKTWIEYLFGVKCEK